MTQTIKLYSVISIDCILYLVSYKRRLGLAGMAATEILRPVSARRDSYEKLVWYTRRCKLQKLPYTGIKLKLLTDRQGGRRGSFTEFG